MAEDNFDIVAVPNLETPSSGGAIRSVGEKFATNPANGTGSMSIPLDLPSARGGEGPVLHLTYNSGSGNGPFGLGWQVALPAVTRTTARGVPLYGDGAETDTFLLSDAEDLVPVLMADGSRHLDLANVPGFAIRRYRPRVEGLFARVERWTEAASGISHWRSYSPEGQVAVFGNSVASRVADPDDPRRTSAWLIAQTWDRNGNAQLFDYAAEDAAGLAIGAAGEAGRMRGAQRYLKRIRYGNRQPSRDLATWAATDPAALNDFMFEVVFDYGEDHIQDLPLDPAQPPEAQHRRVLASPGHSTAWTPRPDPFSSYRTGFEIRSHRRCRRILIFHSFPALGPAPVLVRAWELGYDDLAPGPVDAETERAHHGSTALGSRLVSLVLAGFARDAAAAPVLRGGARYDTYLRRAMPGQGFTYSNAPVSRQVEPLELGAGESLPEGLDGRVYRLADIDGEGLPSILTEAAGAWYLRRNLGAAGAITAGPAGTANPARARFGPLERLPEMPASASLNAGSRLMDLAGDGEFDVVTPEPPDGGFFERSGGRWRSFRPFAAQAVIDWNDPALRLVDLTGDGLGDVLITGGDALYWRESLGEEGWGPARQVATGFGGPPPPRLVFAGQREAILLADMSGDGLSDLVRVAPGAVDYWPNLGHGRFGDKVAMADPPALEEPDGFDPARIHLADIDGTGTNDVIYFSARGAQVWFNRSGNGFTAPVALPDVPPADSLTAVATADLLGTGTACLVWSTRHGSDPRSLRYLALTGGLKPNLLVGVTDNFGSETQITYVPSTRHFVEDRLAGRPWRTSLGFPVQVVSRVDEIDHIAGNRFTARFAYHHGAFDGVEREFRGFGLVEHWDSEDIAALDDPAAPPAANVDAASNVPPVLTRTWTHLGLFFAEPVLGEGLAGVAAASDPGEYWREPGLNDAAARARLLPDSLLPPGLSAEAAREAMRALKGRPLRREVYVLDGPAREGIPLSVEESSHAVRLLQARGPNRHAVFLAHGAEVLSSNYERAPQDPRLRHGFTLEVDDFGNVLREAEVAYGRRAPDPALPPQDQAAQSRMLVSASRRQVTNGLDTPETWLSPRPAGAERWQITGLAPPPGQERLTSAQINAAIDGAPEIGFEAAPGPGIVKRLLARSITLYRADDLTGPLAQGQVQSMGHLFERYRLALTEPMRAAAWGADVPPALLDGAAGYVHPGGDAGWWIPSGRSFFSPDPAHGPAQELAVARQGFFRQRRIRDPLHSAAVPRETVLRYDADALMLEEIVDPLGNRTSAGARDAGGAFLASGNDYRTLKPATVCDPNRNRVSVLFDALGMTVATARMGKVEDAEGDSLAGLVADLTEAEIAAHIADPIGTAPGLIGGASARIVPDLFAYARTAGAARPAPVVGVSILRETHLSDLAPGGSSALRLSLEYSDAFGRVIQKKTEAKPGPVPQRGADGAILIGADGQPVVGAAAAQRWIGTGWAIFNNKGRPVRAYEPFFSDRPAYEPDLRIGASTITLYDPMSRKLAQVYPDRRYEKVVIGAWGQAEWDAGDTVLVADPTADPDVGPLMARLPAAALAPSWRQARIGGGLGGEAQAAAAASEVYADTPLSKAFDCLGRVIQTTRRNAWRYSSAAPGAPAQTAVLVARAELDIDGSVEASFDALGRLVERNLTDMTGTRLSVDSMDAGRRRSLSDVKGNKLLIWDARGLRLRNEHDALNRVARVFLTAPGAAEVLIEERRFGEGQPGAEAANQRGRLVEHRDQSGILRYPLYDFKNNVLSVTRRFAADYRAWLDWSAAVALEGAALAVSRRFDALDRTTGETAPDGTVTAIAFAPDQRLDRIEVTEPGQAAAVLVGAVDHAADGRRTRLALGNGAETVWTYDPLSKQVVTQTTRRPAARFPGDGPSGPPALPGDNGLQSLAFTYDAAGNLTRSADTAQPLIFFRNRRVEASQSYRYDALGQIIEGEGREHLGQLGAPATPDSHNDAFASRHPHPGDGQAMGRYLERYLYDGAGNMTERRHHTADPALPDWTRSFTYQEQSRLLPAETGNRLTSSTVGGLATSYSPGGAGYDANGNMLVLPQLSDLAWDHVNHLAMTQRQAVNAADAEGQAAAGQRTWYRSLADGSRTRKVTDRPAAAGGTRMRERLYFQGFEIYRDYAGDGVTVTLERTAYNLRDGERRLARIERRTAGADASPARLTRYQIALPIQTVALELDDRARILSYEEFTPFGSTSYQGVAALTEVPKQFRFAGRERDVESGLYIIGTRYYASWLCRWTGADPKGTVDGNNLYAYVNNRPTRMADPGGTNGWLVPAAEGVLGWIAADVVVPEPTDAAWPKWVAYGVAAAAAGTVLYLAADAAVETVSEFRGPETIPLPEVEPIPIPLPPVAPPVEAPPQTEPRPRPEAPPRPESPPRPGPEAPPRPEPRPRPETRPRPRPRPETPEAPRPTEPDPRIDPRLRPRPGPEPLGPDPIPVDPRPAPDDEEDRNPQVRIYVTYTKSDSAGRIYSGRSSGLAPRGSNYLVEARRIVAERDANHHRTGLGAALLDEYAVGEAVSYANRYTDAAYFAIRGREQQLIDHHGGSRTDGGTSLNDIRGVGKDHAFARAFHLMANYYFGELHSYTGN